MSIRALFAFFVGLVGAAALFCGAALAQTMHSFNRVNDPYFGAALYHYYQSDVFESLSQMLAALAADRLTRDEVQAQQLLAEVYLAYGMPGRSSETLRELRRRGYESEIQDHAWLNLSNLYFRRGYYREAENALRLAGRNLEKESVEEKQALSGALRLAQGDYVGASRILGEFKGKSIWADYARYNLGIALLNSGQTSKGVLVLHRLGGDNAKEQEIRILQDRANLALGNFFLRTNAPARAVEYLERVRLDGIHASRALLGLGSAYVTLGEHEQALVPLAELPGRSVAEEGVIEGYLALANAVYEAQSPSLATRYYETAISLYMNDLERLAELRKTVAEGTFIEDLFAGGSVEKKHWLQKLPGWPASAEARLFFRLYNDAWFKTAVDNYRELIRLAEQAKVWGDSIQVYDAILAEPEMNTFVDTSDLLAIRSSKRIPADVINNINARSTSYRYLNQNTERRNASTLAALPELGQRVQQLQKELGQGIDEHRDYLKTLALAQITDEQHRITDYLNRARFAVAEIYEQIDAESRLPR